MALSRRSFLWKSGVISVGFSGLSRFVRASSDQTMAQGYGPLLRDPERIFDLPEGFSYRVLSKVGDEMDDGLLVPGSPDGMAAFPGKDGRVILVRNHELSPASINLSPYGTGNERLGKIDQSRIYDMGDGKLPGIGGTTNIVYNPADGVVEKQFLSLGGTVRNCAGGPTPWGTWITCEETNHLKGEFFQRDHGYNFEVPASSEVGMVEPVALKAMGRFRHEAIAVEPKSGVIYETEDMWDSLIYRFLPDVKGQPAKGGKLQALMITGQPGRDTRNWSEDGAPNFEAGVEYEVEWVDLDEVEAPKDDLRYRGRERGAAVFARGEGMWFGDDELYFACTNGGEIRMGQVFRYKPSPYEGTEREAEVPGRLSLFLESKDKHTLKNCDNLTLASNGDIYIAEDADAPCKIVGVTPEGQCFDFASNRYSDSELAGVCFSPDGSVLFVNIQTGGLTLAITGPWKHPVG
jgi:hypothetical protein